MANKLTMAHERRKLQLRAAILNGRQKIAGEQERVKRAREELRSMTGKGRSNTGSQSGFPQVKVR